MSKQLIHKNMAVIRRSFIDFANRASSKSHQEGNKTLGEVMVEIWNAWCEDRGVEIDKILDLSKTEDLTIFLEMAREELFKNKDVNFFNARYATICDEKYDGHIKYNFHTDQDLLRIVSADLESIAESALLFPHAYSRDFYCSVIWPVIENEVELEFHEI